MDIYQSNEKGLFLNSGVMYVCNYTHYCFLSLMHKCCSPLIREHIRSPDIRPLFPLLLYMGIEAPSALWFGIYLGIYQITVAVELFETRWVFLSV